MPGFKRVFRSFPGFDVLTQIESVNIIDIAPPGQVLGAGTGVVLLVGEFERGSLESPFEVFGTNDLLTKSGSLGLPVGLNPHAGPVAVKSGGDELWNGNGFTWLRNKKFSGLILCRVDNSAGQVAFSRLACLTGLGGVISGVLDGDTVEFTRDGSTVVTATYNGASGVVDGDGFPPEASQVWQEDNSGPTFVDETSDYNDATDANLNPFPAGPAVGDAFYIGRASGTFAQVTLDNANGTAGTDGGALAITWEYWDGTSWTSLAGVTDGTSNFTAAVADGQAVTWTEPTDWARTTVNGTTGYYVRGRVSAGAFGVDPIYDQGFVGDGVTAVTGFVGGETLEIQDGEDATRVVVFTAADQTPTQVADRVNAVLANSVMSVVGSQLRLSSTISGGSGHLAVVGGTARSTLGFNSTTQQQVLSMVVTAPGTTAAWSASFDLNVAGVTTTYTATYTSDATPTDAEIRDGLLADFASQNIPQVTLASVSTDTMTVSLDANRIASTPVVTPGGGGTATFAETQDGLVTAGYGTGNVASLDAITAAERVSIFDAQSGLSAGLDADGLVRVCNSGTPVTGTLQATGGTITTVMGFDLTTVADAAAGEDVTISAGTRVQDSTSTGTIWVTLEDIGTGTGGGAFSALVRPLSDDDTALASTAGNVSLVLDTLPDGFSVTNAAAITRLSSNQLDARYQRALDATLGQSTVARKANIICSARASASIGRAVKLNAIDATAEGLAARKAIVRPPLGTFREDAKALTGVGVGNLGRDERAMYCFPGFKTQVPEIQAVGAANGGVGFTDDGVINVGADSFYAGVRSILNPEENAGQRLSDTNVVGLNVVGMEDAYDPERGGVDLVVEDYKSFLQAGIIAPRISRTSGAIFQSDVTSVDPSVDKPKVDANRRFFADLVIDTLADIGIKFVKKLNTPNRNRALIQEIRGFLRLLQSPNQPETSRLDSYEVFDDTTDAQRAEGIVFIIVRVRMYPAMKFITFRTEIGATVVIEEAA